MPATPAYRPVLACHGWGELQSELNVMSKRGLWQEMGERIDDEILHTFAIVGEPGDLLPKLRRRCSGLVDRLLCTLSFLDDERAALETLRA